MGSSYLTCLIYNKPKENIVVMKNVIQRISEASQKIKVGVYEKLLGKSTIKLHVMLEIVH